MDEEQVISTEVAEEPVEETEKETTEEVVEEKAEVVEPPRKKSAQERIDELTRKRREAERDAEYWKAKATQQEAPKAEKPSGRPTLDQFETHEEFVSAVVDWTLKQKETESQAARAEREEAEALASYQKRANKLRAEHDDYDELVESTPFTPYMRKTIANSDNGPAVAYYLGQNREIAESLCNLSPDRQIYELGKLETKILLAKETKKVTAAPKPISPVGMGGGKKEKSPDEMTDEEYWEWDKKQFEAKIKKKYGG